MNWVDLVVLGVMLVSGLLALTRGLVREALGLGAWLIAAVVASPLGVMPLVRPWVDQHVSDPALAETLSFVGVFVVVLVLLSLLANGIANAVRGSMLGGIDRMLGFLFGLARGALLVCIAYIVVGMAIPVEQWPSAVVRARSTPVAYRGAVWIADHLPSGFRPVVAAPRGGSTSSAGLTPANP